MQPLRSFLGLAVLFASPRLAAGEARVLGADFDDVVFGGEKSVFVKFFAPWCGHCKKLKPDWDALADKLAESGDTVIADVDCTDEQFGKQICDRMGVRGYPGLKYWLKGDKNANDYEGSRDLDALTEFVRDELGKPCTISTIENCNEENAAIVRKNAELSPQKRHKRIVKLEKKISDSEAATKKLLDELQGQFRLASDESKQNIAAWKKSIKLLKAAELPDDEDDEEDGEEDKEEL